MSVPNSVNVKRAQGEGSPDSGCQPPLWLDFLAPARCALCGAGGGELCGACLLALAPRWRSVGRTWALLDYSDPSRKLVHAWKYGGQSIAPRPLLFSAGPPPALSCVAALVPAPQSRWRFAERGYNQARFLADWLGQLSGATIVDCLREPWRRRQSHLAAVAADRDYRRHIVVDRRAAGRLAGRPIWLVDDVQTTGQTLLALERALAAAGHEICGRVVLAHVGKKRDRSE